MSDVGVDDHLPVIAGEMIQHLVAHIAPEVTALEGETWVLIVDTVILVLTIIGACFVLGGMAMNEIRKRASTTRMRLVQSLIISDVMLGVVGLIGCTLSLDGRPLILDTPTCDGLGVMFHAIIFSQHCWTLTLAFCTFMILTKPLHIVTSWIEKYWAWTWVVVWVISFTVSVTTYIIYGYQPAGGICYLGNNTGLFGELIQFLPRAIVFLFITFFYGKLYVFLRRPDKIRSGLSDHSAGESSFSKIKHSWMGNSRSRMPFMKNRQTKTVVLNHKGQRIGIDTGLSHTASNASHMSAANVPKSRPAPIEVEKQKPTSEPQRTRSQHRAKSPSRAKSPDPDLPPWERIELPVFQIDGQKYGGSSTTPAREGTWAEWRFSSRKAGRSSTPVETASPTPATSPLTSPIREKFDKTLQKSFTPSSSTCDKSQPSPGLSSFSSVGLRTVNGLNGSNWGSDTTYSSTPTAVDSQFSRRPSQASGTSLPGPSEVTKPMRAFARDGPSPMDSFNPEERRPSLPNIASGNGSEPIPNPWRRPSYCPPFFRPGPRTSPTALAQTTTLTEVDIEKGFLVVEEDETRNAASAADVDEDGWDLKRFLEAEPVPAGNDPFVITQRSENVEYVPESMASYLNRKTALLMLWFPLGYLLLFSVSLIHIIYDFVGYPPDQLRAIARWMIFGQGLLNGIIYGVVEWHTKRVVRRRVRRGTFSPHTSQRSSQHVSGLQALRHPIRYYHEHHSNSQSQSHHKTGDLTSIGTGQIASRRSPQVSFVDPESSIMQRLDLKLGPTLDEY
ncbi:hypothetical protein CcaverHIS002_0405060 [Cutaneotrichosporon cavernicola]|uniref:Glucose receptor Git3-like N-terminal domain-containing protein n=1 Tax=Cutaneotrichosporon cavernicola TaxID=279322 RepID=A0AA48QW03_9TREE|nr:uncharacterized protein CcaverHIS019_0405020 [Cutaneotrichosporon cavernicola]BEI83902.1 hypothetical protein CcaverHIS002_0405060 [Cutaneotrichosporon cavernicola]BEI91682.1 hypothetical protein CcaverHIS019_0405020 [Cutaneotrichosporon cavernicola]BEI99457.1 hypothetical protein CcaverHIS631_0405000 [Cutaneotrichosporon cavernicola]BEJ07235.1 hypothetical protein CcaverHIS641_0405040 [Cutaneotrichosporon cavernicola]